MANNEISVAGTLVANTAQTVTLAALFASFTILNEGTASLYASTDGTTASLTGANTFIIAPNSSEVVPNRQAEQNISSVSLISTAAVNFVVTGDSDLAE